MRTTPQSSIVVGSQHIVIMSGPALMKGKNKPLHISIAMASHEKHSKIHSSIATEVHELDVQHLIDVWMKTLPLDNSDSVASEVTTQTVYGF